MTDKPEAPRPYKTPTLQRFGTLSRVTQGSGGNRADGSNSQLRKGNPRPPRRPRRPRSERKLKHHIVRIGSLPMGADLYLFDYREPKIIEEQGRQLGVMADEVELVMPDAVSVSPDGFKRVDYSLLNIRPEDVIAALRG